MEFKLRNAFKFYQNLDHQNQAIDELEQWLHDKHPEELEKFHQALLSGPTPEIHAEAIAVPKKQTSEILDLASYSDKIRLDDPIIPGGDITWAAAIPNGDRHLPENKEIVQNIITLAEQLQVIRDQIGKPFRITSWYHHQPFGFKLNGASKKEYVMGGAVDFWVEGYTGPQLAQMLDWWEGGLGTYLYVPYMVHLDIGPRRRWQAPYPR
ncbi:MULTISPECIES: D-Ala-D-Ala carboxypeptidase family metallohydrolase [Cyanophyceae]|uniref:D-Ala-D-Ala carboxypeptidase family metallohydrolase n=1 Tax=Cyanophyceae TaxID=3028117 RepID=UPI00168657C2|nr:D-Ala-D-Ala carboxypeptidase family metallohydrolase [Trichocoleus sp. FACHB-40]MBD2006438.1 hypothetical protein [Trichocoleus sp. FACHB-40]